MDSNEDALKWYKHVIFISSSILCDHQGVQDTVVGMVSNSGIRSKKAKV